MKSINWLVQKHLKCVVLCAGRGSRMLGVNKNIPKVMSEIISHPILWYVVDYWKKFTDEFIFVVGYKKEKIINFVKSFKDIKFKFVEQNVPRGIAHAVGLVKHTVEGNFIVVLGDCICRGTFSFPENMKQGIGVWRTKNVADIKRSYSVEIKKNQIARVVEKPKEIINDICGMGYYFFNPVVFNYIEKTPPSALRNEVEITDVIENMIESGEIISPVFFKGFYMNVTFPEDIRKAEKVMKL